ncbi:MAG: hypothetical protein ACTHV5_00640 [Candidatus Corynebacterium faecigallinarum]
MRITSTAAATRDSKISRGGRSSGWPNWGAAVEAMAAVAVTPAESSCTPATSTAGASGASDTKGAAMSATSAAECRSKQRSAAAPSSTG